MIQVYEFHLPYPGDEVANDIEAKGSVVQRNRPEVLGVAVGFEDEDTLALRIRVSGSDQWKCSGYARKFAKLLLARHGLVKGEAPSPVRVTTEKNLRALTLAEGRTVRDYPDRLTRLEARRSRRASESAAPQ